jgi:hypothetical protein
MAIPPQRYIQWAQRSLNLSGIPSSGLVTDGVDRPEYRKAVREFRTAQNMTAVDVVDAPTQLVLVQLNNVHGAYVRWIHEVLIKTGYYTLPSKDFLDKKAIDAIRKFQEAPSTGGSLKPDGVVGPQTEARLIDLTSLRPPGERYVTVDPKPVVDPTAPAWQADWTRIVEESAVLKDRRVTIGMEHWIRTAPPKKGGVSKKFPGVLIWKSWDPAYETRGLSRKMVQFFHMYPEDYATCLGKAKGDMSLAEIIRYSNRVWNRAMEYYIIERRWAPDRARVVFREGEEQVTQLMMFGYMTLFGSPFRPSIAEAKEVVKEAVKLTEAQIDHLMSR